MAVWLHIYWMNIFKWLIISPYGEAVTQLNWNPWQSCVHSKLYLTDRIQWFQILSSWLSSDGWLLVLSQWPNWIGILVNTTCLYFHLYLYLLFVSVLSVLLFGVSDPIELEALAIQRVCICICFCIVSLVLI